MKPVLLRLVLLAFAALVAHCNALPILESNTPVPTGSFALTLERDAEPAIPFPARQTDAFRHEIATTATLALPESRRVHAVFRVRFVLPVAGIDDNVTMPVLSWEAGAGMPPPFAQAIYTEVDPDRPEGQGGVFPSSGDGITAVTGTLVLARRTESSVTGQLAIAFTDEAGNTRRISGAFGVGALAPSPTMLDAGEGTDGEVVAMDATVIADSGGPLPSCASSGVPRSCGLRREGGVYSCTPGSMVTLGCRAGCTPSLGSCSGDTVLQVCPASAVATPCVGGGVIASNDDAANTIPGCAGASSTTCSAATFVCPTAGAYTVWIGSFSPTRTATSCTLVVR